ncbi:acyl-CoA dehydrogenase [Clostridiisalibacter paucivorans]|uniref:acyl-CoA dehydrogenase n=1 Tax=Clostridiisalibacter paucivorans TaxID=408753 RepID=UPI000479020E|nr:acyl-CoA dehydrogenase [Clostridiisalibacter paucivorans]
MNFNLTPEQKMVQRVVKAFAEKEVEPIASEIDETRAYPKKIVDDMARYGLLSISVPTKYGGSGGDDLAYAIAVEELSRKSAAVGLLCSGYNSLYTYPILKFGTEEQKQKYLKPMCQGKIGCCFALTEPNAGSDAASQSSRIKSEKDYYILNGQKCFITNCNYADIAIVFAMQYPEKGLRGITALIVDADTEGFSVGKIEDKMGITAVPVGELFFDNVKVPKENLLGKEGKGFAIAMNCLDGGRIGIAAQALGIAQSALDESIKYIKEREQFGKPLSRFQGLQWYISEMETKINASRLLVYKAASKKYAGQNYSKDAAMAKLFASETAVFTTSKAVQLHGGYGYIKDYPVERMMRDAKITEIYEGTSEVMKMVIAGSTI